VATTVTPPRARTAPSRRPSARSTPPP
jgi:hypothetical protein